MRVLVVEDQQEVSDQILKLMAALQPPADVTVAADRDSAFRLLDEQFYDLLVLDLKIPTLPGALDEDPVHGHAVFTRARAIAPGTPILVLTASPAEDFIPTLLDAQQQVDIWGTGQPVGTITFLKKINFAELPEKLAAFSRAVDGLSQVEVHSPGYALPIEFDRLVRSFARGFHGARCEVTPLGGLSQAQVLKLRITNGAGALVMNVVAKLGSAASIRDESRNFDTRVSLLPPQATPRKLATLEFGAKGDAGVFYQLAEGFDDTAFSASLWDSEATAALVANLEQLTAAWSIGHPQSPRTINEIRNRILWDDDFNRVVATHNLDWVAEFEGRPAQTNWCCVHGDLHGENALVSPTGAGVLIDYGDVGEGSRCLDPISLEFSLLFHPKSPLLNGTWPSISQAERWYELEQYLVDCPVPQFVRSVRGWTERAAAGQREIAGTAYAYFIRQLKFETTNGDLAKALIRGAVALYQST